MFPKGVLAKPGTPLMVMFEAITPAPKSTLLTNCCGVCVGETVMGWESPLTNNNKERIDRIEIRIINNLVDDRALILLVA
ncbi:MAG: hypothetical protein EBV59_10760 [Synechococcaceae bacterium WB7_1C_051]|nr:hypothetical protein [Synechococcaceae bacterium WB7_1C_051]